MKRHSGKHPPEPTLEAIRCELLRVQHRVEARELAAADQPAGASRRRGGRDDVEVPVPVVVAEPTPEPPRLRPDAASPPSRRPR